jgi:LmbE family N-acetylglucosaminyl deacetylase
MAHDDGTLLGVWAHPDDEAFLSAGLMASARDAGQRVVVATATWGERGTDDADRWPPERLAELRRRELVASLAAVGVIDHRHLGYRDGGCAEVDVDAGARVVADVLDDVRPDVVVTFGPDGMTGHPDHRAVSAWTTQAWERTGRRAELWYATVTPGFHRRWDAVNRRLGLWMSEDHPCTDPSELARRVACTGDVLARKRAALAAHGSQTEPLLALLGEAAFTAWWSDECFVSAHHQRPVRRAG